MSRLLVVLTPVLAFPIGLLAGNRWLLPLLNMAPAYAVMVTLLVDRKRHAAVGTMLLWAAATAVAGTSTFALWPNDPGPVVLNGAAYRDEMFDWIRTGRGREVEPGRFLPQHAGHLAGFVVLSLSTASAGSIYMGSVLMNFMCYYVASLFRAGVPVWATLALGWQPWAISRVAAFCVLGVVLGEPLVARVGRFDREGAARLLTWAATGIALDLLLKTWLAPQWGRWLRPLVP